MTMLKSVQRLSGGGLLDVKHALQNEGALVECSYTSVDDRFAEYVRAIGSLISDGAVCQIREVFESGNGRVVDYQYLLNLVQRARDIMRDVVRDIESETVSDGADTTGRMSAV